MTDGLVGQAPIEEHLPDVVVNHRHRDDVPDLLSILDGCLIVVERVVELSHELIGRSEIVMGDHQPSYVPQLLV